MVVPVGVGVGVPEALVEALGEGDALGDALGLAVGEGDGDTEGLTLAERLGETDTDTERVGAAVTNDAGGGVKSCTGSPSRTAFMKAVQTLAGKEPPVTEVIPPTPLKVTGFPSGPSLTNITAAASSGV